jgi:hypothetical protein
MLNHLLLIFFMSELNIRSTSLHNSRISDNEAHPEKPRSNDNDNCVCNSYNDPIAIERNLSYSRVRRRPYPSAMLDGTDTAARRICDVNPYISSLGKDFDIM